MTIVCFGANEDRWLGAGWHEREVWAGGRVYRYSQARAALSLDPAWAGQNVAVLLSAPASAVGGRVTVTMRVTGPDGAARHGAVARRVVRDDCWRLVEMVLPETLGAGAALELVVEPAFVPDRLTGNGDQRQLGARVAALRIGSDK